MNKNADTIVSLKTEIEANQATQTFTMEPQLPLLGPRDIRAKALKIVKAEVLLGTNPSEEKEVNLFRKHFGCEPLSIAAAWHDLTRADIPDPRLSMTRDEKINGLKRFLVAIYFLWNYSRNKEVLATSTQSNAYSVSSAILWLWIDRIAWLEVLKIKWIPELTDPSKEILALTIDGTDFRVWEKSHPDLPLDRQQMSVKFNHGALKYLLFISIEHQKVVQIYGPERGGKHDLTMLEESGFLDKLSQNKKVASVDRGFIKHKYRDQLSWPNAYDSPEVNNYKSRSRLRHETFNGRCKFFRILGETFHHQQKKHRSAFAAVVVLCQYNMENGRPLFEV